MLYSIPARRVPRAGEAFTRGLPREAHRRARSWIEQEVPRFPPVVRHPSAGKHKESLLCMIPKRRAWRT
jgi:hypothetical protein